MTISEVQSATETAPSCDAATLAVHYDGAQIPEPPHCIRDIGTEGARHPWRHLQMASCEALGACIIGRLMNDE